MFLDIIPGNIRKAENFINALKRFGDYLKKKLKCHHVVIESPNLFLRELYKEIFLERRSLKMFHSRLVNLLNSYHISDISNFKNIITLVSLATLASTYTTGFALIFEPFDTKTNLYDPHLYFTCLDASIAIKPIFNYFQSVIITSGVIWTKYFL